VLQFLSQQDDEKGCTRNFNASFWRRGTKEPCITHEDLGSNVYLSLVESKEAK